MDAFIFASSGRGAGGVTDSFYQSTRDTGSSEGTDEPCEGEGCDSACSEKWASLLA